MSVCAQLVQLGDAPSSTYLDVLYAYKTSVDERGVFEPATRDQVVAATKAFFAHVPLTDLLARYVRECSPKDADHFIDDLVNELIIDCIARSCCAAPVASLGLVLDATSAVPTDAKERVFGYLGNAVDDNTLSSCQDDDVLGRLDASEYVALLAGRFRFATLGGEFYRRNYLSRRVHARAQTGLAPRTVTAALAIAPEWAGTLDELLETAAALASTLDARQEVGVW
jgi:hypothetical protein